MTAQEKALEMYNKFRQVVKKQPDGTFTELNNAAKQCALIAVEEIIKTLLTLPDYFYTETREFWNEVKTEIEKL